MNELLTLSPQERKILESLSGGRLYKEIAQDHKISINTVKKHLKNVYRKLSVDKRWKAVEKLHAGRVEQTAESPETAPSVY